MYCDSDRRSQFWCIVTCKGVYKQVDMVVGGLIVRVSFVSERSWLGVGLKLPKERKIEAACVGG